MQVSFCKRATNHEALLRKETYKDRASYASHMYISRALIQGGEDA